MIRHITVQETGEVFEVPHLYDGEGKETILLDEAYSCVVQVTESSYMSFPIQALPVFTVH